MAYKTFAKYSSHVIFNITFLCLFFSIFSPTAFALGPGNVTSGLDVWFKADTETSTVVDGVGVSSWGDQSTNNTDAVQATGGNQPAFYSSTHANALNYNPTLLFDGTADNMTHDDANMAIGGVPRSIFTVGSSAVTSGTRSIYSYGRNANLLKINVELPGSATMRMSNWIGGTPNLSATGGTVITNIPFFAHARISGVTDASLDFNGLPGTRDTSSTITTQINTADGTIGQASGPTAATFWSGKISEIIAYEGLLSVENLQKIYSYLALKYGITLEGISGSVGTEVFAITDESGGGTAVGPGSAWGQGITATSNMTFNRVSFPYWNSDADVNAEVYVCNGLQTATACVASPIHTTTGLIIPFTSVTNGKSFVTLTLSSDVSFVSGNSYTVVMKNVDATDNVQYYLAPDGGYTGGSWTVDGTIFQAPNPSAKDLVFSLYYTTTGVDYSGVIDYIASDGTTVMWDKDFNATYNNDIAGIGIDTDSDLDQQKSKSQNADGVMILGAPTAMTNLEFLVAGNDGGTNSFTVTGAPTGYGVLNRKWQAQETGEVGTVTVAFDVADTGFDIPAKGTYYLVWDTDNDSDLSDEVLGVGVLQMYDNATNGDETSGDNIYSINGIDLEPGMLFTIGGVYVPLSGTVYNDQGITNIGAGMTVVLLKNGVATGLTDDTDASGYYEIDIDSALVAAEDILTVFIDGEVNDGVTVFRATGPNAHAGIDIYKDYLIARSETGTAITNTDLDTGHNGDSDFTTIYTNGGTTSLTTSANKNFLIWAGDTWTPGGTVTSNANFFSYGTSTVAANSMNVAGNFYVDNAGTFSHTGTLTLSGGTARTFNQGDDPITSNVDVTNTSTSGFTVVTNDASFNNLTTTGASSKFTLGGKNLTITGAFSNAGTIRLFGNETITGLTQDIDSGAWSYIGDGDAAADTFTIKDFGATDYFNLQVNSTDGLTDTFGMSSAITTAGAVTLLGGTWNTNGNTFSVASSFTQSGSTAGTFNAAASNITVGTTFGLTSSGGVVQTFNAGSGTLAVGTTFTQTGTLPATSIFNAGTGAINVGTNFSITATGATFVGSTGTMDVNGTFTVSSASASFTAPSTTLNVAGNFIHSTGTFNHNNGTVILDKATAGAQTITGATTFFNLTRQDTLADGTQLSIQFPSATTQIIAGTLTLSGNATEDLLITASTGGSAAVLNSTGLLYSISNVNVTDNTLQENAVTKSPELNPSSSVNGGNTLGWFSSGISGTVYTDEGVTSIVAGKTVRLLVNGVDSGLTDDTDAFGGYFITGVTYAIGDVLTVYLDDETENGATVTIGATANANISSLDIYQNFLKVHSESATAVTNTHLDTSNNADPGGSSDDLTSLYTVSAGTLTTTTGTELWINAGDTFAPAGNLDLNGNFDNNGTVTITTHTMNLAGNFDNDAAATFTAGSGTVILDGTAAQTVTTNGDSLFNVRNSNVTANVTHATAVTAGGTYTLDANALTYLNAQNFIVTGTFSNDGTIRAQGGEATVTLTSGQDTDSGTWQYIGDGDSVSDTFTIKDFGVVDYYNLVIMATDSGDIFQSAATKTIGGTVVVSSGTYDSNITSTTISGLTTISTGGTYLGGNQPQTFGGGVLISGGTLTGSSGATMDVNGDLTISSGIMTAPSVMSVQGNFTNNGTYNHNNGQFIFDYNNSHSMFGSTTFGIFQWGKTTDTGTDVTLTVESGTTQTFVSQLSIDGVDADDRANIVASTPGSEATFVFSSASTFAGTNNFLDIMDSKVIDNSTGITLPLNPPNSVNSGNTIGWFDAVEVEFSTATASSTDEATANNFPVLLVYGVLTSAQTIDVDITGGTATNGGTDYTMTDPLTINIPAGTYDGLIGTAITITVPTLVQDAITETGGETIIMAFINPSSLVSVGDANSNATTISTHTYTITDDDLNGVIVELSSATATSTDESVADNFPTLLVTGTLASASTIQIDTTGGTATGGGTDYTYTDPLTITIPAGTYDGTAATDIVFTVPTLVQDAFEEGSETITFSLINAGTDVVVGDANTDTTTQSTHTYTITDDDMLLVEFTIQNPSALESVASPTWTLTVSGGTLASSATVEVANLGTGTATSGGTDFTFATPVTITIPAGNYSVATTINITGLTIVEDVIAEVGGETIDFTLQNATGIALGDADGNATNENTSTFTITDNDTPNIVITESSGSTAITEGGATDTYTIGLTTIPTGNVSITLTPDADCTVSPAGPLTFNSTTTQTVTVTAVDDVIVEGAHTCTITHTAASADLNYNAFVITDVVAAVTDNDTPAVVLVGLPLAVKEADPNTAATLDTFTVALSTAPTSDVTITLTVSNTFLDLSDGDESNLSTITLTFTPLNYNTPQTVTTTPVDDIFSNGTRSTNITYIVDSLDLNYDALAVATTTVSIQDGDDEDGDGVDNSVEDANPFNGGDGNGDGFPDSEQQSVSGAPNPVTGDYTTVEATGACVFITENAFIAESALSALDPDSEYPVGLVDFQVQCPGPGQSATITIYYTEQYDTSGWSYKKFNSLGEVYSDITGIVTFGTDLVGATTVTTATFTVTDGDPTTDEDGIADNFINDPSGPAVVVEEEEESSGGGGGGGGSGSRKDVITPFIIEPAVPNASLLDLIGGEEPNVPAEFSDYVCVRYLRSYILPGQDNKVEDVKKLEEFLNVSEGEKLLVDGVYGDEDIAAVKRFQEKYRDQILAPWGLSEATGRVGRTTTAKINIMLCSTQKGCPYFNAYLKQGDTSLEAVKVQDFINIIFAPTSGYPSNGIPLSKTFENNTFRGVSEFQTVYKEIVLKPWGLTSATGWWYKTSRHAANQLLNCNEGTVALDNGTLWGSGIVNTTPVAR